MDDALILNFIRLVRNGRNARRCFDKFIFGDLILMDDGPCQADEEALQLYRAKRGFASPVALVVYVKGSVAEIWHFHDFRTPTVPPLPANPDNHGIIVTERQELSLNVLVRVVFAYLRIHELFAWVMDADPGDVLLRILGDAEPPPSLDADTCAKTVWAVDGLASVKVAYNRLWRVSTPHRVAPLLPAAPPAHSRAAPVAAGAAAERRAHGPGAPGSESAGSGRSMPTPYFASVAAPGSIGSAHMSASQFFSKSPTFGPSEFFLPSATTNASDSVRHMKGVSPGAAALAAVRRGARTRAIRGHTFCSLPNFAAIGPGSSDEEDEKSGSLSTAGHVHELLEICDEASLTEAFVDLNEILDVLDKKLLSA